MAAKKSYQPVIFLLFVLSGFCGLLYQVIWLRLAFAAFGIVTPVLSVVVSVFMVGLALGSWLGGIGANRIARTKYSPLWLYGAVELLIGLGAFVLPVFFAKGEMALLQLGDTNSTSYLISSGLWIALSILPWTICMGATYPAAMAYLKRQPGAATTSFSYLYLGNVIGAMAGALLTAIALVELLGFSQTLWVAALVNGLIAVTAFGVAWRDKSKPLAAESKKAKGKGSAENWYAVLFLTGFTSMAMEVVWTRAFTPALRTNIYAFAMLLATYLFATWVGSFLYRKHLARKRVLNTRRLLAWAAFAACLPIAVNDPRLFLRGVGALLSIFPFCALLGYLTPLFIDRQSNGDARTAGMAYAVNIVGCVLGPLVAGYLLLPYIGVKWSLILLALPFFYWVLPTPRGVRLSGPRVVAASFALLVLSVFFADTYEERAAKTNGLVLRDHTATVIAAGEGPMRQLYVNGVAITFLTPLTKLMAHIPLAALGHEPQSALVICFGMGTTFRSLLTWDIDTWAAELVPSVRETFGYFFSDGPGLMKKPNAHVVIDDGRRFLRRTDQRFDVITLDPPPPIEAAGSSLLYSTGFYRSAKARLREGGILAQWFPGGEIRIQEAIAQAIVRSFAHVRAFRSHESNGIHFLASDSPLDHLSAKQMLARTPPAAQRDLVEWWPGVAPEKVYADFLAREIPMKDVHGAAHWYISDDRPLNEYYLLRRTWAKR